MSNKTNIDATNAIDVAVLQEQVETLKKEVDSLKKDRDNALRWGIMVLGTAVLSMAMWIFNQFEKLHPLVR